MTEKALIESLGLEKLEGEGGYYRRIHSFKDHDRVLGSVIYYLITNESFSSLHKLSCDEVWYYLEGEEAEQLVLYPDGSHTLEILGKASEQKKAVSIVRGGCYQGTRLTSVSGWALYATSMSPPFEACEYQQADASLLDQYPDCKGDLLRFINE